MNFLLSSQTYFKPALKNVRENLDDTSITDDFVSVVTRRHRRNETKIEKFLYIRAF